MKRYVGSAEGLTSNQRIKVAERSTDPKELSRLAYDNSFRVREAVAGNSNAPEKVLELLANDSNELVRWYVAQNRNTSANVLELLASDESEYVRLAVAKNSNTPEKVLELLANDVNRQVRKSIAGNPNTPAEALELLASDDYLAVREYAANNRKTSAKTLELLANDVNKYVRRGVAHNPNTPADVLELLANDSDEFVRQAVAGSPQESSDISSQPKVSPKVPSRSRTPKTDWSIPLYSITNYSVIEDEIDQVIHDAANQYAAQFGGSADVDAPSGVYDAGGVITITIRTNDGDTEYTVDAEDILGPATSRNKKKDCVKYLVQWMKSNLK